jgi:hypothetical protein
VNKVPLSSEERQRRARARLIPFLFAALFPLGFSTCSLMRGHTPGGGSSRYGFGAIVYRDRSPEEFWALVIAFFVATLALIALGFRSRSKYLSREKNA